VEPKSLTTDRVVVREVVIEQPELRYERGASGANLDALQRNAAAYSPEQAPKKDAKPKKVVIGRFVARGGKAELIEGSPEPQRVVIIEFANAAAVKRWYNSPEYQKALPIRLANSSGRAFIVEGA